MSEREQRLDEAIAAYYQAREKGEPISREDLLSRYADLADELSAFLDDKAAFERRVGTPAEAPTVGLTSDSSSTNPPSAGTVVRYFGDYELLKEIARGGMGVVYKARQVSLNRLVALKMILAGHLASDDDVRRFQTEAEAAANLDHPNILPIYEVGEHEGQHFFSMKLVEGGSLVAARFDDQTTARLVGTVARAVHHAHQRSILHRDLKPGNILLSSVETSGEVVPYVTDFGLAKKVEGDSGLTHSGAILGTPSYMAPEQARAEKHLSTGVDVYALGAILYELLTGQPPFRAATPLDTILHVLEKDPTSPRSLRADIDRDLEIICLKCLNKEPASRYDSAASLADDLERWLRGEPILARPTSSWEKAVKWARRRPAIASLCALVVMTTTLGFVGVVWQWQEAVAARLRERERAEGEEEARINAENAWRAEGDRARAETKARDEAERNLYLQQIALARQAWATINIAQLRDVLEQCPPRYRGWEWSYLKRLCQADQRTIPVGASVRSLAYRPDGRLLAVGGTGRGSGIVLLDPLTGKELQSIHVEAEYINRLAFSPDGKLLAVSLVLPEKKSTVIEAVADVLKGDKGKEKRGRIHLYNPTTGKLVRAIAEPLVIQHALAFRPDGLELATGGEDNKVRTWEVSTGRRVAEIAGLGSAVRAIVFRPDGKQLAAVCTEWFEEGELKVWDRSQSKVTLTVEHHGALVVAWSPDGRWLATGGNARLVRVLDAATGSMVHTLVGHQDPVTALAFHPDGRSLFSGSADRTVRIWDHQTGRARGVLRGHEGGIEDVACSPDGRQLASCARIINAFPRPSADVKLWDATRVDHDSLLLESALPPTQNRMRTMFEAMSSLFAREAWFGRDGQHVSLHKLNGQVVTWDTRTGAALAATDPVGLVLSSAYRPDGQQMAVLRMRLEEKDLNKITSDITVPEGDQIGLATGMVRALFQGDIVELSLHEVKKGKVAVELEEPLCWLCAPAYSGDGRLLAAASLSHVKVWDTTTGKIRLKLAQAPGLVGSHFAFSADGRWLVVGSARTKNIGLDKAEQTAGPVVVVLIDLKTGKEQRRWTPACTRAGPLVFSPDSRLLVLPGKDPVMELREVESGALRATLPGHVHAPFLARISPDGALLATASWDGSVRLWSMETGKLVLVLRGHTRPIQGIAFHPDGKRLVSSSSLALSLIHRGDTAGEVKLWDVASGRELLTLDGMGPVYFSPDGTCLIATGQSFTSRVWSGATLTEAEQAHRRQVWEQGKTDWHTREALAAKEAKQWQTVVFHLSRLIEVDSNNRFLHGERGSAHRELEQYDKARSDFGRVIEIAPRAGFAWYARRGWMSMELGDTDRAIEDLNIAVSMDHKDTFTRALRGRAWLAKEEWQKAIDDLNLAIAADKKEGHYLAQRGQAFAGLGKWKEAEEDVRQALKRIKEANWLHEELAVLRLAQGDVDGYRRILREIITRHEKSPTPEEASGLIFSAIRVPDVLPAESLLRLMFRASEAKTKPVSQVNGEEQMQQGAVYYRAGLFAAARDRLLEAEKARGKSPSALDSFFLALCHQRLRNADQARAAYARGVRLVEEAEKSKALNWEQRLNRRLLRQEVEDTLQVKP